MAKKAAAPKRTHVIKRESGWAVKKEGAKKASKVYTTKDKAIRDAEKLQKDGHDIVVHKKDGSIQTWKKSKK